MVVYRLRTFPFTPEAANHRCVDEYVITPRPAGASTHDKALLEAGGLRGTPEDSVRFFNFQYMNGSTQ